MIVSFFMLLSSFCDVFALLCPMTELFTTYYISITILQHYTKFNAHTIAMLEKLLR
jgi:hypothetical protein